MKHGLVPKVLVAPLLALTLMTGANGQAPQDSEPTFHVEVVSRTVKAINYNHRSGWTDVGFEPNSLIPKAKGKARVESRVGATKVDINVDNMPPATTFGEGYLTYVVWAITPEGRAENMGELLLDGDHARLQASSELQTFGMIVTAEPYYAVSQPSDNVVMENVIVNGTTGTIMPITAKYELLPKGAYEVRLPPGDRVRMSEVRSIPLDLVEARHALAIARSLGADRYATETMEKAQVDLGNAEAFLQSKGDKKKIESLSRHVTQLAEDARLISVRRAEEDRLNAERQAAQQKIDVAQAESAEQQRQRALAEQAQRESAEKARREAEQRQQAEAERLAAQNSLAQARAEAAAEKARLQAEVEAARLKAESEKASLLAQAEENRRQAEALKAQAAQWRDEAARAKAAAEAEAAKSAQLRADLLRQFNVILETRETARGLIVNLSDVLFQTARYDLKPGAREKLAKVAGIILGHPGLKLEVEGHTDSVGSEEYNQTLSEKRASSVRDFLVAQGISVDAITSVGFGKTKPVADNATAAGRQQNRRVELVVSGAMLTPPASSN